MIISLENINGRKDEVGAKALRLKELFDLGFRVPAFAIIPAGFLNANTDNCGKINEKVLELLSNEITGLLKSEKYAVRSSALVEDGSDESLAGQFLTKLALDKDGLAQAISEVAKQAHIYLGGRMDEFSIIIQKFIEADISGVAFTRSPFGGREMVIESVRGRGDKLVGGESKPERNSFYWNEREPALGSLLKENVEALKKIESHYEFPQDIEWCQAGGKFYILQTRPITSISQNDYAQILYLDKTLKNDFYYQKTEISEIAPRPKPVTMSLLNLLYAKGGPIELAYAKYRIKYEVRDYLKIIGNELYVNKEEELRALFPAKSYLLAKGKESEFVSWSGLLATFKNILGFSNIRPLDRSVDLMSIKTRLEMDTSHVSTVAEWLKLFFKDCKVVFEINLLCGAALNRLKRIVPSNEIGLAVLLRTGKDHLGDLAGELDLDMPEQELVGNSLDLGDESDFKKEARINQISDEAVRAWIGGLTGNKRERMLEAIKNAVWYNRLREYGRWLIVLRINRLRSIAFALASRMGIKEQKDVYYLTIDELISESFRNEEISEKKNDYEKFSGFCLPFTLRSRYFEPDKSKPIGVSVGLAEGVLTDASGLLRGQKQILYTKILSPDLAKHFDDILGIISESGSLLSHLSIIAREKNIPVIVNASLRDIGIALGERVRMDGDSGVVRKI